MKKRRSLKLKLNRETLRQLNEVDLHLLVGGIIDPYTDRLDTCGHVCTNRPMTQEPTTTC